MIEPSLFGLWIAAYTIIALAVYALTRRVPYSVIAPFIFQLAVAALVGGLFHIGALP